MSKEIATDADGRIAIRVEGQRTVPRASLRDRIEIAALGLPDATWTKARRSAWAEAFARDKANGPARYIRLRQEQGFAFQAADDSLYVGVMLAEADPFDPARDEIWRYEDRDGLSGTSGFVWLRQGRVHQLKIVARS